MQPLACRVVLHTTKKLFYVGTGQCLGSRSAFVLPPGFRSALDTYADPDPAWKRPFHTKIFKLAAKMKVFL